MCGITGIYSFTRLDESHVSQLEKATGSLAKRGPDAHKTWNNDRVGLGHRRLSIIDTSDRGLQPMWDISEKYVIVYNGEVYNYRHLKEELQGKGYQFRSETDTEVVLNAYIEWGPEAVNRFNGFFAFAIYNLMDQSLFVVRDRFGIKPLVYSETEDAFLFASELKSLIQYEWDRQLDIESLNLYFQLTYIPSPKSIFGGVQKLEPGHYLVIKGKSMDKKRYYETPYFETPSIGNLETAKKVVRSSLKKAVINRLVSDVPLGSFLSGGIDSSIVTSIAAREVSGFNTFSIGFKDNEFFDETRYAEQLAAHCGTKHHTFKLTNDDLYQNLEEITSYLDEPFADSSAIPVYILSKLTRNQVTVALSGDGADEIFSGYNKHAAWQMSNRRDLLNGIIGSMHPLLKWFPQSRNYPVTNFFRQLEKYASILRLSSREKYWLMASFGSEALRKEILKSDNFQGLTSFVEGNIDGFENDSLNRLLYQDVKTVLAGDMLPKVDFMSMANSLEVRVPFLDHEVVNTAFQIQENLKIKGNTRKFVLREAFKDDLPQELYTRGKKGFDVPLLDWFRNEMKEDLEKNIFNKEFVTSQDIFNWDGLMNLKARLNSNKPGDAATHIWQIYVFQKWWKQYCL